MEDSFSTNQAFLIQAYYVYHAAADLIGGWAQVVINASDGERQRPEIQMKLL